VAQGVGIGITGAAIVCCVHDRQKRELVDPDELRLLYRAAYNTTPRVVARCACCDNLFAAFDDTPRLCTTCNGPTVHTVRGPLADPIEGTL
jgi:hypothetical protein